MVDYPLYLQDIFKKKEQPNMGWMYILAFFIAAVLLVWWFATLPYKRKGANIHEAEPIRRWAIEPVAPYVLY